MSGYFVAPVNLRAMRRASLRRQIALMEYVRDAVVGEPEDDFDRWSEALRGLTDDLLHELAELEGTPSHPHPGAGQWWDLDLHWTPDRTPGEHP